MSTSVTTSKSKAMTFLDLVKSRLCRGTAGLHCHLCDLDLAKEEAFPHVTDSEGHAHKLEELGTLKNLRVDENKCKELIDHGVIPNSSREYRCTFCLCVIPKLDHVSEHVSGKKHISKRRKVLKDTDNDDLLNFKTNDVAESQTIEGNVPPISCDNGLNDMTSKNDKPNIVPNVQDKKQEFLACNLPMSCDSCQDSLKSDSALQYHKMFHLSQNFYNQPADIVSFSIEEKANKRIYCLICDCFMKCEEDLARHLKEDIHQKRLIVLCSPDNYTIMNFMYLSLQPNICHTEFNRCYTQQIMHQQKLPQDVNSILLSYICFICNVTFNDQNLLFLHYNYDHVHKYRMEAIVTIIKDKYMKFVSFNNQQVISCTKCQLHLTELNGTLVHLLDLQHIYEKSAEHNHRLPNVQTMLNNRNLYVCPICKINDMNDYTMIHHLVSNYHKCRLQEYYANTNLNSCEQIIFYCSQCKMNCPNDKVLLEHLNAGHQNGYKNPIPTNNMSYPNISNVIVMSNPSVGIVPNNFIMQQQHYNARSKINYPMPLNNVNFSQTNLMNHTLNANNNNHQKYITTPNSKQIIYNQDDKKSPSTAFIRTKNLINFCPRYVKMCIERGDENIFTIDSERIRKLELGISLTFPYESSRCCIPCGVEVSNDFQLFYEHLRSEQHETNLQEMEDNDKYFENYRDQFSDLELAKEYMYEDSDQSVKCYVCDIIVENCKETLRNHINSELHIKNQSSRKKSAAEIFKLLKHIFENLWYYIEKFFCNLCCASFDFEVDYARHLEDINHLREVEKRIMRKQTLQFDCCILCSSYWYAKSDQHKIHCDKDSHKYKLKSRDFTVPEMSDQVKNLLIAVEKICDILITESDESSLSDKEVEKKILEGIENVVKPKYPEAKAHLFGSRISYLSSKNSDLDIYLSCGKNETLESREENGEILLIVKKCFYNSQDDWKIEESIMHARVPIIKLKHRATNLVCDISFINSLSVAKSRILGYFVNACLPCRKLILFLKKWSSLCQLSGRKGINSFAMSWFVIFYLQIKGFLPSVQKLIEQENKSNIIAGWETGVSSDIPVKEINLPIKDLLQGFFKYFAEFHYISDVACPFLGKIMKKSKFSDIDNLPDEMSFYKTQIKEIKIEYFRLDSPMCIQEPIDLSQNMTKSVTKLQLRMFKQYCTDSAAILEA